MIEDKGALKVRYKATYVGGGVEGLTLDITTMEISLR